MEERKPATLRFRVVADESGEPLPDARVLPDGRYLRPGEEPPPFPENREGTITLRDLREGGADLFVGAPGRATRSIGDVLLNRGENGMTDVRLALAGTVRGRILGRDGLPLPGVSIRSTRGGLFSPEEASAETGEDGGFTLEGLAPGTVSLEVKEGGPNEILVAEVPAGGTAEASLGGVPQITGRSVGFDGRKADFVAAFPLGGDVDLLAAWKRITGLKFPGMRFVDVAEDGTWSLSGLSPGDWFVGNELSHAVVRLEAGAPPGARLDLHPRYLTGRVVRPPGGGAEAVSLLAVPEKTLAEALRGDRGRLVDLLLAIWKADQEPAAFEGTGDFTLPTAAAGAHLVFASCGGGAAEGPARAAAAEVPVPGGCEILLVPASSVEVRQNEVYETSPVTGETEGGPGLLIALARDGKGAPVALAAGTGSARLGILPGRYALEVHRSRKPVFREEIIVPAGKTVEIDLP